MGWFRPTCPVEEQAKIWIEERMTWLVGQYGRLPMQGATVLPTDEFFPDEFAPTPEAITTMLHRVCGYMNIDSAQVDLSFYAELRGNDVNPLGGGTDSGTSGLYGQDGGRIHVAIEMAHCSDPTALVATMAHELAHARLMGEGRVKRETVDNEPLTDLATVFFGLGIFTANVCLRDTQWSQSGWHGWSVSRRGYLGERQFAYALSLYAWGRGELKPAWLEHLSTNVRVYTKEGLAYLAKTRDTKFVS